MGLLYSKGQSLRCSPGPGNPGCCTVTLSVGEGFEREQWRWLHSLPDFSHFPRYPQAKWALLVLIPRWVVCVQSRTLLVPPMNSPVRLGVSPTASSTPTGVFNQKFEALFPHAGTLRYVVYSPAQFFLLIYSRGTHKCETTQSTS